MCAYTSQFTLMNGSPRMGIQFSPATIASSFTYVRTAVKIIKLKFKLIY